jgi:hypothetical protein
MAVHYHMLETRNQQIGDARHCDSLASQKMRTSEKLHKHK